MFSRLFLRCVVLCAILYQAGNCRAAVITEGDAEFNGDIFVAHQEGDGSLTITAPTVLAGGGIHIADQPEFTGTVTVDGGAYESLGGGFVIGALGTGNFEILNGGRVSVENSRHLIVGSEFGSQGNVLLHGVGSLLDMPQSRAIVGPGGFGTFTLKEGARASHQNADIGGSQSWGSGEGHGVAYVTDSGSRWDIGEELVIGNGSRASGELWIQNGGQVHTNQNHSSSSSIIGRDGGSGMVVVEGAGSLWQNHGYSGGVEVSASFRNGNGSVAIRSGGKVISSSLGVSGRTISFPAGSGLVTIDGFGSQWITGSLSIGNGGTGQVLLTNGAKLIVQNDQDTVLGSKEGSFGRLVVDGASTQWLDSSNMLIIGRQGYGELNIQNGAAVINQQVALGPPGFGGASRGEVSVTGPGSRWQVAKLTIGGPPVGMGGMGSSRVKIADGAMLQGFIILNQSGELALDNGTVLGSAIQNQGLLRGQGEIHTQLINQQFGQIRVGQGERLVLHERLENMGQIDIQGGELEMRSINTPTFGPGAFILNFSNSSNGVISMENATLRLPRAAFLGVSALNFNDGSMVVSAGTNRIYGSLNNRGSIRLSGNSQSTFYDDIENNGTINVSTGSIATFFGDVSGNGVAGGGTVFLEGDIAPGFSPGVMEFGGDVVLGSFSELNIEIDGLAYGSLDIAGDATVGGGLVLSALAALDGDTMLEILSAESILGTFDSVPTIGAELGFGVLFGGVSYNDDSVVVSLLQQSADFNADGSIDDADLAIFSDDYGSSNGGILATGDADRDGDVDGGDFLRWQRDAQVAGSPIAAGQTVPEPSSVALIMLAKIMLIATMRRP